MSEVDCDKKRRMSCVITFIIVVRYLVFFAYTRLGVEGAVSYQ